MATCCGVCDYKVVAVIPVHGRLPLLKYTIQRLYEVNKVFKVICVGESAEERQVTSSSGAVFLWHPNRPLGAKWNAGFVHARQYNPDACLFVGSSDWIDENWIPTLKHHLKYVDMVGLPGMYLLDIGDTFRACHWSGYVGHREGESIGIGRMIRSKILDRMDWKPFIDTLDNSMDGSMQSRVIEAGGIVKTVNEDLKSLSISTNRWPNKHKFEDHYSGRLKSEIIDNANEWIDRYFPEAKQVFK